MRRFLALLVIVLPFLLVGCIPDLIPSDPAPAPSVPNPSDVLFSDDFENGTDPDWQFASGSWEALGGWLHLTNNYWGDDVFAYVRGGDNWDNYRIEADIEFGTWEGSKYQGFVLHAQDDLNKVVAWASNDRFLFSVFANGEVVRTGGEVEPGWPSEGVANASVEAQGDTYRFYVNDVLRSTFTDTTYSQGKPGLAFRSPRGGDYNGFRFDNCIVISLE